MAQTGGIAGLLWRKGQCTCTKGRMRMQFVLCRAVSGTHAELDWPSLICQIEVTAVCGQRDVQLPQVGQQRQARQRAHGDAAPQLLQPGRQRQQQRRQRGQTAVLYEQVVAQAQRRDAWRSTLCVQVNSRSCVDGA